MKLFKYSLGIMLVLPIGAYLWKFRDLSISNELDDWAHFGDYIGGCYSIVTAFMAAYVAILIEKMNWHNDRLKFCVDKIVESYGKLKECRNSYNSDNIAKIKECVISECIIMDYYVKSLPSNIDNKKLREIIQELKQYPTQGQKFDLLQIAFDEFIMNLPMKG